MNCEHEFENANCTNCANGLPSSAYECAKTKGRLKEYCHERAEAIHRQKYNEGYENGYEQGRADAIEEVIKLVDEKLTIDIGMDLFVDRDLLCERLKQIKGAEINGR